MLSARAIVQRIPGGLFLLFMICFILPVALAVRYGTSLYYPPAPETDAEEQDEFFPEAVLIQRDGAHLRVPSAPVLEPGVAEDFLLIGWFKLRKLPEAGKRMYLLAKFDSANASSAGYALALIADDKEIHPAVYWKNRAGQGGWNTFSKMELVPREWFMVAISYYDQKKLGVHVGRAWLPEEKRLQLGGGFEFEKPISPQSKSALVVGSIYGEAFRGKIGPFMLAHVKNLGQNLEDVLQAVVTSPRELPHQLDQSSLAFYTLNGRDDISTHKHRIEAQHLSAKMFGSGE